MPTAPGPTRAPMLGRTLNADRRERTHVEVIDSHNRTVLDYFEGDSDLLVFKIGGRTRADACAP